VVGVKEEEAGVTRRWFFSSFPQPLVVPTSIQLAARQQVPVKRPNSTNVSNSTVPADDATDVPIDAGLVATFSEPVVAGTGTIELW
jgi:hypothetical protein